MKQEMKNSKAGARKQPAAGERSRRTAAQPDASERTKEIILLAVTGISPAILTETIWGLAEKEIVPARVVVITTATGLARLKADLLDPNPDFDGKSVWDSLREALEARKLPITDRLRLETQVIKRWNKRGLPEELRDIREVGDNQVAANFIMEQVRAVVEIPDTQIIASIAGGRKTMGALLHSAMTLLGRERDRVTHVLVPETYENILAPRFYFPEQPCGNLQDKTGGQHLAKNCAIELADVPFVPIRNLFEKEVIRKPSSFTELVERCRSSIVDLRRTSCDLVIRESRTEIQVNGVTVRTSPAQHVIISFLGKLAREKKLGFKEYYEAVEQLAAFANELYESHDADDFRDWRYKIAPEGKTIAETITERWITKNLSDLRGALKRAGPGPASLIALLPETGRFSLDLHPSRISIEA